MFTPTRLVLLRTIDPSLSDNVWAHTETEKKARIYDAKTANVFFMNESPLRLLDFSSTVAPGQSFLGQALPSTLAIAKGQIHTRIWVWLKPNRGILRQEQNASTVVFIMSHMP
jgi:hypothetical protein